MSVELPSPKQVVVAVGLVAGLYGATVLTSPLEDEPAEPKPPLTVDRDRPEPFSIMPADPPKPRGNSYLGRVDDAAPGRDGDAAPR